MILLNPKYKNIHSWLKNIPNIFEQEGVVIYDRRNRIKTMPAPDGTIVCIKRYHVPALFNRLVYSWGIRQPKGYRAYTYPQVLLSKNIETPEPIAYIEERHNGLLGYSYFVSVQCTYEHTMYDMGNAPEALYRGVATALAHYTAHMHEQGVLHLDYSPGNILWTQIDNEYRFSIVDTNRMYFGHVNMQRGCENFKRLWGPRRFFIMLVREYAKVRGFDVREAKRSALTARARFWMKFKRKHSIEFDLEL